MIEQNEHTLNWGKTVAMYILRALKRIILIALLGIVFSIIVITPNFNSTDVIVIALIGIHLTGAIIRDALIIILFMFLIVFALSKLKPDWHITKRALKLVGKLEKIK